MQYIHTLKSVTTINGPGVHLEVPMAITAFYAPAYVPEKY